MPRNATSKADENARAVARRKKGKSTDIELTPLMQAFIDAAAQVAARGKTVVLKDIAAACGLAANRPSKWMKYPVFKGALTRQLGDAQPVDPAGAAGAQAEVVVRVNNIPLPESRSARRYEIH